MRSILAVAALATPAPALAETIAVDAVAEAPELDAPAIKLVHPGPQVVTERATLALRVEPRRITGTLTLALSATHFDRDTPLALEVPAGTRITGMTIATKHVMRRRPDRLVARPLAVEAARADYEAVVAGLRDPALLEWAGTAAGRDRLALRVFPLGTYTTATVELALVLPRVTALAIDPDDQRIRVLDVRVGGKRELAEDVGDRRTIALAPTAVPIELAQLPPSLVTPQRSLFAGVAPPRITVTIGQPPTAPVCLFGADRNIVRRVVRAHHPQLRRCYERVAQVNPHVAGTAVLHFTIGETGSVRAVSVDGELDHPEVAACLAREARSWQFPSSDIPITVNYPLHFRAR